jgi:transcriptional regulator with PAS, ATPase and Fis domain
MGPPIVGVSRNIEKIKEVIEHVANTGLNTIIYGESGVGKEVVAQKLYHKSSRKGQPFVKINCAALPEGLLESELFGYERGAFTGADQKKRGKFELANKGVLFLDEIGDMSLPLQSKLLHVLQSGEFAPLGSEKEFRTDTWVIAATNHDLEKEIETGSFRRDFFYRINVIKLRIPPLRDRKEDIPLLIEHFLDKYSQETTKHVDSLTARAQESLRQYDWPGNVRELENAIERAVVLSKSRTLGPDDFSFLYSSPSEGREFEAKSLREVEKHHIAKTLETTDWNVTRAAKILGINRVTLHKKIKRFDLKS